MLERGGDVDDRAEAASFARYTHRSSHRPWAERMEIGDLTARLERPRNAAARRLIARSRRASHARRGAGVALATARLDARASRSISLLKRVRRAPATKNLSPGFDEKKLNGLSGIRKRTNRIRQRIQGVSGIPDFLFNPGDSVDSIERSTRNGRFRRGRRILL